jgi:hypothetical protein
VRRISLLLHAQDELSGGDRASPTPLISPNGDAQEKQYGAKRHKADSQAARVVCRRHRADFRIHSLRADNLARRLICADLRGRRFRRADRSIYTAYTNCYYVDDVFNDEHILLFYRFFCLARL